MHQRSFTFLNDKNEPRMPTILCSTYIYMPCKSALFPIATWRLIISSKFQLMIIVPLFYGLSFIKIFGYILFDEVFSWNTQFINSLLSRPFWDGQLQIIISQIFVAHASTVFSFKEAESPGSQILLFSSSEETKGSWISVARPNSINWFTTALS